jgi:hypothetical protein
MRHGDVMKDPFYAGILYEIERRLHEADQLGAKRGIKLTDSQVRSVLVKAVNTARGRPPKPAASPSGGKEQLLLELGEQLQAVRANILVQEAGPVGPVGAEMPLPTADWVIALEVVRESCELHSGREAGSRGYLDYLRGFLPAAKNRMQPE